jgi:serine/threonine protein phosphatase 1
MQLDWQPPCFDSAQTASIAAPVVTFIGDVHGYSNRLDYVLEHIPDHAHIVFLGDLIDRGPQSREVVATARSLITAGRASAIIGNHEYALVRGLGIEERGIPGNEELLTAWCYRYGGDVTVMSYGLDPFHPEWPHQLRDTLGDDLYFLADLPWYLWGEHEGQNWLALHAGLDQRPLQPQAECGPGMRWLRQDLPRFLYAKDRQYSRSPDIPDNLCLVSGHTPQPEALVTPGRILADTSGGGRRRSLSAVLWPSGEVIASPPMAGE